MTPDQMTMEERHWVKSWRHANERPRVVAMTIQLLERGEPADLVYFRENIERVMLIWPAPVKSA
jgi:hypothetical protein